MLSVDNLTFKRNENIVFKNLGFTLFAGAILNIIGSNGSGKSSFLKMLATIYRNIDSKIFYLDENIYNIEELYKQQILYVGHKNGLKNHLTVLENLAFWASASDFDIALNASIFTLGLQQLSDYKISELSQGLKKRVSLAKLLLSKGKIWLLDEPFNNLDKDSVNILNNMITARANQNGIVIITSHEPLNLENVTHLNMKDFEND